jgi:hypothetical protein
MKTNVFLPLFLALCGFAQWGGAQCDNVTVTLTPTASNCQSDGTIRVTVAGADAANLDMTTALYKIDPVAGTSYMQPWSTAAGGILTGIPPGTYRVQVMATCTATGSPVTKDGGNTTVAGSYVSPDIYTGSVRKTFNCTQKFIGRIPIVISGGRAPYSITMTAYPAAYTGQTSFSRTAAGTANIDDLPAGNYAFVVTDACGYNTSLAATVGTFAADFIPEMISPYLYMPGEYTADCRMVRINPDYTNTVPAHELRGIYNSTYYEVGTVYRGDDQTQPTEWTTPNAWMNYRLGDDRDIFRKNGYHIAVWVRIKGTNCAQKIIDLKANAGTGSINLSYTAEDCNTALVSHSPNGASYYNHFCYPYQWCLVEPSAPYDTIMPWSEPVEHLNLIQTLAPFGKKFVYRDAKGNTIGSASVPAPINNIHVFTNNTVTNISMNVLPNADGYLPSYTLIYSSGNFSIGTRIQYISGPPGAPEPNYPDFTIQTSTTTVYPHSGNTSPDGYTSQGAYNAYLPPGDYTFRVTICGNPKDLTRTLTAYRVSPRLQIDSTKVTCEGLRIYPSGQLQSSSDGGATWTNATSWYSLHSGPSGTDHTGVSSGGYLLLPVSGEYVVKLTSVQGSTSSNSSIYYRDTLHISYERKPLSLDANLTSAYACGAEGAGFIRVQGANGSGSYAYELRTQGGATLIDANATGRFTYGQAGETYTIRVKDNTCNTYFDQDVTILNLSGAQIAYSSGGSMTDVFCQGQTLQLNCIPLGSNAYRWEGPDGWTSTEQNPARPNAVPSMSGRYTVEVTPEGCNVPMSQSIDIIVSPCVAPINPHLRSRVIFNGS